MRLAALPDEPRFRIPYRVVSGRAVGQMTLGTAQLGLEYGVANRTGKPNRETAAGMVRDAIAHGVTTLDTARAYGDAEEVLGSP
jgi:spore coat polysaccharide biosynthesis protein SpsF